MAGVKLTGLTKHFGATEVIRGVDLEIADGEFVVFVGPSGCGKSTLLRLIAGLEEASAGTIDIGGRDVTHLPPAKRGVAMVFQSYALYPHMTVYKNIAFGLTLARTGAQTVERRVREAAKMLQIDDLLDRLPRELSGGQRQRVAIARAIVRDPEVFLFDEPLSNLDASLRAKTRLEIGRMHEDLGRTMIYVTHDQLEAMTLADRIVLLRGGSVEQVGTPTDLYHRPATRFAAQFMGSPTMNVLPVEVQAGAAVLTSGDRIPLEGVAHRGPADLGVRPENLHLAERGVQGRVVLVEELGDTRMVHVALTAGEVLAVRDGSHGPAPRRHGVVHLRFDAARLHLFEKGGRRIVPATHT